MSTPVIFIGAGGHSKVLIEIARLLHRNILGIVDSNSNLVGKIVNGCAVLGDDSFLDKFSPSEVLLVNGVGSTSLPLLRKKVYENYKARGFFFDTLCHPTSIISPTAVISEGCQIMAGAIVQPNATILNNSIINTRVSVDHDSLISEHCHIAPGSVICGDVNISSTCHVGAGSVVLQACHIGCCTLVGAGSVVTKDVPSNHVVVGSPASPLHRE